MLANFPALVLNADFQPQQLFPLLTKSAIEAIGNVYEDTVTVVAEYDQVVRSPSRTMRIPSVVALRTFIPPKHGHRVIFSKKNVFLRDRYRCQYCGSDQHALTVDHVLPTSRGGTNTWTNTVAACNGCNSRKGDTVGLMHPMKVPREPTQSELHALARALRKQFVHSTWLDYLPAAAA